ncbi:hypothetical protein VPHD292_0016 [Vibrio phage D292]
MYLVSVRLVTPNRSANSCLVHIRSRIAVRSIVSLFMPSLPLSLLL